MTGPLGAWDWALAWIELGKRGALDFLYAPRRRDPGEF